LITVFHTNIINLHRVRAEVGLWLALGGHCHHSSPLTSDLQAHLHILRELADVNICEHRQINMSAYLLIFFLVRYFK